MWVVRAEAQEASVLRELALVDHRREGDRGRAERAVQLISAQLRHGHDVKYGVRERARGRREQALNRGEWSWSRAEVPQFNFSALALRPP